MKKDDHGRLVGWKAIAAYLGKDVRTVLRWERDRGLPIHRPPGGRGQSVYAIAEELDRWIARPRVEPDVQAPPPAEAGPASAPARHRFRFARSRDAWLAAAAALAALLVLYVAWPEPALARVEVRDLAVRGYDDEGREIWSYPLEGRAATASAQPGVGRATYVGDLDGDGSVEALASVVVDRDSPDLTRAFLLCLDARGGLKWAQELDDTVALEGRRYGPPWAGADLLVYGEGPKKIVFSAHHYTWSPSLTVAIEPRSGRRIGAYLHDGWMMRLGVTSDARHIVAAGIHKSGSAHAVAVLDADLAPAAYFPIPRPDGSVAAGEFPDRQLYVINSGEPTVVRISHTRAFHPVPETIVEIPRSLADADITYSAAYWTWHDRLEREGRLGHSSARCPFRRAVVAAGATGAAIPVRAVRR